MHFWDSPLFPILFNAADNAAKKYREDLAGVAQWIECWPANQKVAGWIPSQGTCLGCRPGPQLGACERQPIEVSLAH